MVMVPVFSVQTYNQLLTIAEASSRFKKQLASACLTESEFFSKLAPLFSSERGPYSPCLIHHHFGLAEDERMVSYGNFSEPSKDTSPNIVPECWLSTGEEMEHRYVDDPSSIPPPPSADFFSKFKAILDKYEIDVIGVCYSPPLLKPEYIYLETLEHDSRLQIINQVLASSIDLATTTPSIWTLMGPIPMCGGRCITVCVDCPP